MVRSRDVMTTRKLMTVLFVGVVIGFIFGILVLSPKKTLLPSSSQKRTLTCKNEQDDSINEPRRYQAWLSNQGVVREPLDVDDYLYGTSKGQTILESDWLKTKVHITCVVFVEIEKNAKAALHTWLKHCNDYAFYHAKKPHGRKGDFASELGVVITEAKSSWDFLCKVILDMWRGKETKLQWLLFVSDDMFVVPENLRRMVGHLDWNDPYYLGHAQSLWGQPFNIALAGYVLSKGAVQILAENFTSTERCPLGGKYWKKEDYYLGKNLEKLCVLPSDTRDVYGKGRFHGYNLNQLLFSNKLALISSYWKDSIYPSTEGKSCCSDLSVTFQGIEADKMYMYNYIINHLRVFTHGHHGSQPAPTPYPPEQVWQDFMRSRGFSSVANVSAKQYFEAWKAKINEDLVKAGYKKSKHIWRGLDFKNGDGHGEVIPLPFQFETVLDTV